MTFAVHAGFSDDQLQELAKRLAEKRVERLVHIRSTMRLHSRVLSPTPCYDPLGCHPTPTSHFAARNQSQSDSPSTP